MISFSIGLSGNVLRLLGLDASGKITSTVASRLSFDFGDDQLFNKNPKSIAPEFSEHIATFLKNEDPVNLRTGVTIDTSMAFINVIPLDLSETSGAVESHILWELSNYYPDSYKDFSKRFYKLGNPLFGGTIDEAIIIAIDRRKIRFIKNLCSQTGILPKNIEIDHFAVEKCLTELFGRNVRDRNVIISSCSKKRIDSSLLVNTGLKFYDYDHVLDRNPLKILFDQLIRIKTKFPDITISEIFLYGDISSKAIVNDIGKHLGGVKITHLDLFGEARLDGKPKPDSSVYAPLVGLALKNLSN